MNSPDHGTEIRDVVRELNEVLGPTLVAALAWAGDRGLPLRWAKPHGLVPAPAIVHRLALARSVWTQVSAKEGDLIARAFLVGGNPALGGETPLTAIREERRAELLIAVGVFLEGSGSWGAGHPAPESARMRSSPP